MNCTLFQGLRVLFTLASFFLLLGCENIVLDEPVQGEDSEHSTLHVFTRATDGLSLEYPLCCYAFSADGNLQAQSVILGEGKGNDLMLPKGKPYRIVICSIDAELYSLPKDITLSSVMSIASEQGYVTRHPLMMGFADLASTQSNQVSCNIQLQHQMASLRLVLRQLPASCTDVAVSVSSPYSGIGMNGVGQSTPSTAYIPLTYTFDAASGDYVWDSDLIYLFPTCAPQTIFTIAYTDADGEHYSSVVYQNTLHAGTPYQLNGTFNNGSFQLQTNIIPSSWGEPVHLDFSFGDGKDAVISSDNENQDPSEDPNSGNVTPLPDEEFTVSAIPAPYTFWEGHIVAAVLDTEDAATSESGKEARLLLMSQQDWANQTSYYNETNPTQVFALAESYAEDTLEGWRLPTEDEARMLYNAYNDSSSGASQLEKLLSSSSSVSPVALVDDKLEKVRYLCADAKKTYSFGVNSILNAGKTIKTYHLRLVKTVKVIIP